ncbi:electron transfer flavoprotein subunit alpha/FixB family protein [Halorubrum amylolyticum]|uniref:electron transfer flavoprotein subunit alpha/FixB family protein n=1 Tax=Halorubrum amylolyticum TaxID=2508724 RepID=UPI0010089253|nr:electron transfer flavoprotein subunit alpha/FixB family protein [Halorubrum amylolyticum]
MTDVLAVTEHRRGDVRDVSYEIATAARQLADETGGDVHLAVIGGDVDTVADQVNREGVDAIHTVDEGEEFNHDIYTQAVEQLYAELDPQFLLAPNSVNGMDYVPASAEGLDLPLVTDAVDLEYNGNLTVTREQYGGKVETTIDVAEDNAVVTIRPAEWAQAEGVGDADVQAFDAGIDESQIKTTVTGYEEVASGDVDISEAEFLVSIGRGIEEEENLPLIEALVEATDATLSSSRPIVDSGWLPKNRQVGQSGKVVTPDVYIAIGISGAVQHVAGMKGAETIIAINTDPNAPIMDIADYAIVDDLFDVVPLLIEEFGGTPPDV